MLFRTIGHKDVFLIGAIGLLFLFLSHCAVSDPPFIWLWNFDADLDNAVDQIEVGLPDFQDYRDCTFEMSGCSRSIMGRQYGGAYQFIFIEGSGDCPSGCIDLVYNYIKYYPDTETIEDLGSFARVFDSSCNCFVDSGNSMWGVPE